jgi:hypothetical protein
MHAARPGCADDTGGIYPVHQVMFIGVLPDMEGSCEKAVSFVAMRGP